MTRYLFIAAAAAAVAAFGSQAQAQDQAPAPAQAAPQSGLRGNWLQADMTRQQAQQRADRLFQRFDLNHDGIVTREEAKQAGGPLMAERAASGKDGAPGLGGHTLRFLERTFAGAQSVTEQQFEQAMLAHFDQMDLNHDGVVTADERQQARGQRRQERGD